MDPLAYYAQPDPETFVVDPGLEMDDTRGWPYLLHNLVHDLAALNKAEMVLWDSWGLIERGPSGVGTALPDRVAELARAGHDSLQDVCSGYEREPGLKPPPVIKSHSPAAAGPIEMRLRI